MINASNQVAFAGVVDAPTNSLGIWSEGSGNLSLLARRGQQAAGAAAGVNYESLSFFPIINAGGDVAFTGSVTGAGVTNANNGAVWSGSTAGSLHQVVREGDQATGAAAGQVYSGTIRNLLLNDAGDVSFSSTLSGPGITFSNDRATWLEQGGGLDLLVREGDTAVGNALVRYRIIDVGGLDGSGQIAFHGDLTGTGINLGNDETVVISPTSLIARKGDQAAGLPAGADNGDLRRPDINANSEIAFHGFLTGAGSGNSAIWSGTPGNLDIVARRDDQAPGQAAGVEFADFGNPGINANGDTVFTSLLSDTGVTTANDRSIWAEDGGSLRLVAREGEVAPGTGAGITFGQLTAPAVLNASGHAAFDAGLSGTGIDSTNDRGLWVEDPFGVLQLIVREGDLFEVSPGVQRTVSFFDFITGGSDGSGNSNGEGSGFSDSGDIAFRAAFTDGSQGVFVGSFATPGNNGGGGNPGVPAPSSALLFAVGLGGLMAGLMGRRRRSGVTTSADRTAVLTA